MRYGAASGSASGVDPFAKVKALISDLIDRLEKENVQDANLKEYCDAETSKTETKKDELQSGNEQLTAKIDKSTTDTARLKAEVAELASEVTSLTKQEAELIAIRQSEHAAFMETKADLESSLEGVRMALKMMKDYYQDEESTQFLQSGHGLGAYSKASDGTGIIGMLEVIDSDFAKSLAEEVGTEEAAVVVYQKTLAQNKVTKAVKESDIKYKTKEAASLDKSLTELSSDREGLQSEMAAQVKYTENLRAMCDQAASYEETKARREDEIKGLKEALMFLDGEGMFIQSLSRGLLKKGKNKRLLMAASASSGSHPHLSPA